MAKPRRQLLTWGARSAAAVLAAYLLLLIPDVQAPIATLGGSRPFVWDEDEMWASLEARFVQAKEAGCSALDEEVYGALGSLARLVRKAEPSARELTMARGVLFQVAPVVAACPTHRHSFFETVHAFRQYLKKQSIGWNTGDTEVRTQLYRGLYGARIAEEQVLLQTPPGASAALVRYDDVGSATPSAVVGGVPIHSGDLLLSRGGAPTSALIARGNDYPGNFSHVAIVHVGDNAAAAGTPRVIEAHIERGVAIASVDEYLADTKLRILVLRPRPDLPAVAADPLLPHRAASAALERAGHEHVPYDFAMDFKDPRKLFCSEVASTAYRLQGVDLWMDISTLSSAGLMRWLSAFGVRHFRTQAPSDLEYDPQLALVAEWRDLETLRKAHVDNAVVDAMLELAESGQDIEYNRLMLPLARLTKAWSAAKNALGSVGPIPEGMSATSALRNRWYSSWHDSLASETQQRATVFQRDMGYFPPYWRLVEMARTLLSTATSSGAGR